MSERLRSLAVKSCINNHGKLIKQDYVPLIKEKRERESGYLFPIIITQSHPDILRGSRGIRSEKHPRSGEPRWVQKQSWHNLHAAIIAIIARSVVIHLPVSFVLFCFGFVFVFCCKNQSGNGKAQKRFDLSDEKCPRHFLTRHFFWTLVCPQWMLPE